MQKVQQTWKNLSAHHLRVSYCLGVELFSEFLQNEGDYSLLRFWFACKGFREQPASNDPSVVQRLAFSICRTFVDPTSSNSIGQLALQERRRVTDLILGNNKAGAKAALVDKTAFAELQEEVFRLLEAKLATFLDSDGVKRFISTEAELDGGSELLSRMDSVDGSEGGFELKTEGSNEASEPSSAPSAPEPMTLPPRVAPIGASKTLPQIANVASSKLDGRNGDANRKAKAEPTDSWQFRSLTNSLTMSVPSETHHMTASQTRKNFGAAASTYYPFRCDHFFLNK